MPKRRGMAAAVSTSVPGKSPDRDYFPMLQVDCSGCTRRYPLEIPSRNAPVRRLQHSTSPPPMNCPWLDRGCAASHPDATADCKDPHLLLLNTVPFAIRLELRVVLQVEEVDQDGHARYQPREVGP